MKLNLFLSFVFAGAVSAVSAANSQNSDGAKAVTPGVTQVVQIKGMDKAPVVKAQVAPTYPTELRGKGIQGFATVDMLVDSTGRVVEATVARATHPLFGEQAVEAAKAWNFEPAMAGGHPITTRVRVPFEFVMPQIVAMEQR